MVDFLTKYFIENIPNDNFLQKISLLYQEYYNNDDEISYSITTLWLCITQSIIENSINNYKK